VCLEDTDVNYNDPDFDGNFTYTYDVDNSLISGTTLTLKTLFDSHHELLYGSSVTSVSAQDTMSGISLCGLVSTPSDGELVVIDLTIPGTPAVAATLPLTSGQGSADTIALS